MKKSLVLSGLLIISMCVGCNVGATHEDDSSTQAVDQEDGTADQGVHVDADMHQADLPPDVTPEEMGAASVDMMRDMPPATISCDNGEATCTQAPLDPQKYCCPREAPSCDCPYMGGTMNEFGACGRTCDAAPVGWSTMTDGNGCEVNISGAESCL